MKTGGIPKHVFHIQYVVGFPFADITVKQTGALEHVCHGRDACDVPTPNRLVKQDGPVEPDRVYIKD